MALLFIILTAARVDASPSTTRSQIAPGGIRNEGAQVCRLLLGLLASVHGSRALVCALVHVKYSDQCIHATMVLGSPGDRTFMKNFTSPGWPSQGVKRANVRGQQPPGTKEAGCYLDPEQCIHRGVRARMVNGRAKVKAMYCYFHVPVRKRVWEMFSFARLVCCRLPHRRQLGIPFGLNDPFFKGLWFI